MNSLHYPESSSEAGGGVEGQSSRVKPRGVRWVVGLSCFAIVVVFVGGVLAVWLISDWVGDDSGIIEDDSQLVSMVGGEGCGLPEVELAEQAISIGVPDDWLYEVDGDTVAIMEDEENTTAVFLYTAKLDEELTSDEFLNRFAGVFRSVIEGAGGSFELGEVEEVDALFGVEGREGVQAMARAEVAEGELEGEFAVDQEGGFVTFRAYWAPVGELGGREAELQEVVNCFSRDVVLTDDELAIASSGGQGVAGGFSETLIPGQGAYFSYAIPEGWSVVGESDSGIDIESPGQDAAVSVAYVTGASGPILNRDWAEQTLTRVGVTNYSLGEGESIAGIDENHVVEAYDFRGALNGAPVAGRITVAIYNVYAPLATYSSPFTGIQVADAGVWDEVRATTQAVQDSVTIIDIGARKDIKLPSGNRIEDVGGDSITSSYEYKQAVEDAAGDDWGSAMRGYESVESPSTGDIYDAPINSWNPYGSDGAGYYRALPGGGAEKLEVVR